MFLSFFFYHSFSFYFSWLFFIFLLFGYNPSPVSLFFDTFWIRQIFGVLQQFYRNVQVLTFHLPLTITLHSLFLRPFSHWFYPAYFSDLLKSDFAYSWLWSIFQYVRFSSLRMCFCLLVSSPYIITSWTMVSLFFHRFTKIWRKKLLSSI